MACVCWYCVCPCMDGLLALVRERGTWRGFSLCRQTHSPSTPPDPFNPTHTPPSPHPPSQRRPCWSRRPHRHCLLAPHQGRAPLPIGPPHLPQPPRRPRTRRARPQPSRRPQWLPPHCGVHRSIALWLRATSEPPETSDHRGSRVRVTVIGLVSERLELELFTGTQAHPHPAPSHPPPLTPHTPCPFEPQVLLDASIERVKELCSASKSAVTLLTMQRPLANATKLYRKTRPSASREAVARAKELGPEGAHPFLARHLPESGRINLGAEVELQVRGGVGCGWRAVGWGGW